MDDQETIDLFCFVFSQRDVLAVNSIKGKGLIMEAKTSSSKLTFAPLLTVIFYVYTIVSDEVW